MAVAPLKNKFIKGLTDNGGVVEPIYGTNATALPSAQAASPGVSDTIARADHAHQSNFLKDKSGVALPFQFAGNPKRVSISFAAPFPDARYSVSITSSEGRAWLVENQAGSGFEINSQANRALVGTVYWQAKINGESQ
jgi:hypothetical protein